MVNLKRNTKILLICLCLVPVLVTLFVFNSQFRARVRFEETKRGLVNQGQLLDLATLYSEEWQSTPNGGKQFVEASRSIPRVDARLLSLSMRLSGRGRAIALTKLTNWPVELAGGVWADDLWETLPIHIDSYRGEMESVFASATNGLISIQLPLERDHVGAKLGHISKLKYSVNMAAAMAYLDLYNGDVDSAVQTLMSTTRLVDAFQEPFVISALVRNSCAHILARPIWELLLTERVDDQSLAELQHAWSKLDFAKPMTVGTRMEMALALTYFEKFITGEEEWRGSKAASMGDVFGELRGMLMGTRSFRDAGETFEKATWKWATVYHDVSYYLECMVTNVSLSEQFRSRRSYAAFSGKAGGVKSPSYYFTDAMLLRFEYFIKNAAFAETVKSMVTTAIAIKRFQMARGRLPSSTDELVPHYLNEPQIDWMDGKRLRYRPISEKEFRLWSIGTDLVDGAGVPVRTNGNWTQEKDLIWPMPATAEQVRKKREELERERASAIP